MSDKTVNLGRKGSFKVKPGALHAELGIPLGEHIPESRLEEAKNSSNPTLRRRAISAIGFKHMNHGK